MLKRKIAVRICGARNLMAFTTLKKRNNKGIEYQSLDPMFRVECAGIVHETTAILGSLRPEWDQDLVFDISIPPGEIHDVQSWVDRQLITISLLDFDDGGIVPVLLSAKKPMWQVLRLNSLDCIIGETNLPVIEVSIIDNTQERWAWAKLYDAYITPDDLWQRKHPAKFKNDLKNMSASHHNKKKQARIKSENSNTQVVDGEKEKSEQPNPSIPDIWTQYNTITRPLRTPFRRRTFHAFILDENNTICPLTSCVRPIIMHDHRVSTPREAAIAVSCVPYQLGATSRSDISEKMISQHLAASEEMVIRKLEASQLDGGAVAGWHLRFAPQIYATENFFAQVSSPQTMLMRRRGSLFEHALLLCGLLLGMGLQSYVAIGKVKRRPYIWVITITPAKKQDLQDDLEFDDFTPCSISYYSPEDDSLPITYDRTQFKLIDEAIAIQDANRKYKVTHWDPLTGWNWASTRESGFPYERLETLFNHQNVYYNVQKSDLIKRPFFSWNLHSLEHWIPLFQEPLTPSDPIKCMYSTPSSIMYPLTFRDSDFRMEDKFILKELIESIQLYRRHVLYIPETTFHRKASKHIQTQLNRFESDLRADIRTRIKPITGWINANTTTPNNNNTNNDLDDNNNGMGGGGGNNGGGGGGLIGGKLSKVVSASQTFLKDNSLLELDANLPREIAEDLLEFLPPRHAYKGYVLHFKDVDLEAIVDQLVSTGILDASVPGMMWVVAARVFHQPFGMASVWVGIGFMWDIIAMEIDRP
ncbi:hypothetical protein HDU76_013262 [Blyttiomyces sp. JEL0837]|nr:hypothetical protein HDU76_013262 [Blyttiomyces sp. JEL0837]